VGQNRELSRFPNAITVLDNGNVAIGTTSFSEGTQPTGTISIIPNSSVSSGPLIQFASNGRIRPAALTERLSIDGNALFLNSTFSGNIIMATGGGNVGIGTTSPGVKLTLYGGEMRWGFTSDLGSLSYTDNKPMLASVGATDFLFYTNATERMRISSSGNIGMGVSNPSVRLDVSGIARIVMPADPVGGTVTSKILSYSPSPFGLVFRGYSSGTHSIQSQRESNDAELYGLTLQPLGGNVAIGNTSPLQGLGRTLTVEGTGIFQANIGGGSYNENLRLNRTANGYSAIAMGGSYNSVNGTANGQWTLVAAPVGLGYKFYLDYAGTETFTVTTSGQIRQNNVGIVQVVPIGPTATNISYSGTINGQYAVGSTSIPSAARWVFADVFVTANISDHQNFMLTRSNFGAQKTWVDTRGNNPANEFGNLTQDDVTFITYFGESDGFTSNYGLWKAGLLIPSSGRNIWINNYGNSGSSGYLYFIVRGYSL
jgi:hypothetical protein